MVFSAEVTVRVSGTNGSSYADRTATFKLRVEVEGNSYDLASTRAIAHALSGADKALADMMDRGEGSAVMLA